MKTILITAYAVNPFKGSEDGTGWNISRTIASEHKVILITRKNNVPHLEKYRLEQSDSAMDNIDYHGFDLPDWVLKLKKNSGERGYVLYFYLWQMMVAWFIKKKRFQFDLAHCLNFHSDSHPNFLWMLGKPTFWGPVGHHPKVPKDYILKQYGLKTYLKDRLYNAVKWCMRHLDPFYRLAVKRSTKVFGINSSVQEVMGAADDKFSVISAVACPTQPEINRELRMGLNILSVGRFHYMKGFDIAIRSFAAMYDKLSERQQDFVQLTLVGKGEEKDRLVSLASSLGVQEQMNWIDWVNYEEMAAIYRNSDLFLFPSHEGAGMVVPEAMSYGLPVLCFDNVGPGELVGESKFKVPYSDAESSVNEFSKKLLELFFSRQEVVVEGLKAKRRQEEFFTWEKKAEQILEAYDEELCRESDKTIAVFHPSSELYGADRILVNALNAIPSAINKRVYLKFNGPLVDFIRSSVENVEVIHRPDLPVIYRKIFTPIGIIGFARDWIRFSIFMRKEHQRFNFRSAYLNTLSTAFVLPIARMLRISNFIHVHEIIDSPKMIGKLTAVLCQRFSERVVCVSQAVLGGMLRYVPQLAEKAEVLHNGIKDLASAPLKVDGPTTFFLFGRIMPKKGQWYLLDALATIPKSLLSNCKFVLMGGVLKGNEQLLDQLVARVKELDLQSVVELREFAPDILSAMTEADACLVPSMMKDPFPTTVLEAMSAGRPVIATDHGGAKEAIVDGESGLLIGPNDPEGLAQKILSLSENRERLLQIGTKARDRFMANFTVEHFNQNWSRFNHINGFI